MCTSTPFIDSRSDAPKRVFLNLGTSKFSSSGATRLRVSLPRIRRPSRSEVLKFRYISYVHFITLPCILLLSLCFGSTCTPLTLLQLRYIFGVLLIVLG